MGLRLDALNELQQMVQVIIVIVCVNTGVGKRRDVKEINFFWKSN